jgi:hypothetical protein
MSRRSRDERAIAMNASDLVFLFSGVIGAVGGIAVAIYAVKARTFRLPEERGKQPLLERFCGAVVGYAFIVSAGCRLSLYDAFVVVRAPGVRLLVTYPEIASAELAGRKALLLRLPSRADVATVRFFLGRDAARVAALIDAKRHPHGSNP